MVPLQANYFKNDADTAVNESDEAFQARVANAPVPSSRCCIDARAYTQYVSPIFASNVHLHIHTCRDCQFPQHLRSLTGGTRGIFKAALGSFCSESEVPQVNLNAAPIAP